MAAEVHIGRDRSCKVRDASRRMAVSRLQEESGSRIHFFWWIFLCFDAGHSNLGTSGSCRMLLDRDGFRVDAHS